MPPVGCGCAHETLARDIMVIHAHRFMAVYGYRKVHRQLIRRGWRGIGRDQVLHVMRSLKIQGVRRGRNPITTRPARMFIIVLIGA